MVQPATDKDGTLIADLFALGGAGLSVTELEAKNTSPSGGAGVVKVGVDRQGLTPSVQVEDYDILLTTAPRATRPWVVLPSDALDGAVSELETQVASQPAAATAAAQVLRITERIGFEDALNVESLAYSMLLGSEGFRAWRAANPPRSRADDAGPRVLVEADVGELRIRLNRPVARNAFDARMRDDLAEALAFAVEHPDAPSVILSGAGPAFSAGGDLDEFGQAADVGIAHLIRTLRSPARLAHALRDRLEARLHGACVGAGIEVPAAAGLVTARPGTVFRLPEVGMGLIPGAGGTATLPRRIGRHRTAYLAISGVELDLATAIAWGLVDREETGSP